MKLADKVAIITGAASGIGRASAVLFAREGATVVATDLNEQGGRETVAQIEAAGGKGRFIAADVSRADDVKAVVEETERTYGRLDIMFNNAGIGAPPAPVEDVTEDVWDRLMSVNVKSVFFGMKYAVPVMKKQRSGVIINTASTAGPRPRPGLSAYGASKGAVIALARAVALEVAPFNIRVVSINPVATESPLLDMLAGGEEGYDAFRRTIPLGRLAKPEDMARAALFLASEDAHMITGTELMVDGGRCIM